MIYNSQRILNPSSRLDSLESLLGHLTVSWDGMLILTSDVNIYMLSPLRYLTKRYQTILEVFGLAQVVTHPTRITSSRSPHRKLPTKGYGHRYSTLFLMSDHVAIYVASMSVFPAFNRGLNTYVL